MLIRTCRCILWNLPQISAEFIDQVMVDSPAGVIPPDRMFELLRERGESFFSFRALIVLIALPISIRTTMGL